MRIILFLSFFLLSSCKFIDDLMPIITAPVTTTTTLEVKQKPLSWNKPWDLDGLMVGYQQVLSAAKDLPRICPKFSTLSPLDQRLVLNEFIVAIAFYESSWNEKSSAVDVGTVENKGSWSIGLMQVSVIDYQNKFGYTYEQLLTAIPNLHLALEILSIQVSKYGILILDNSSKGRYFAVILDNNKYQKVEQIIARVRKAVPQCL